MSHGCSGKGENCPIFPWVIATSHSDFDAINKNIQIHSLLCLIIQVPLPYNLVILLNMLRKTNFMKFFPVSYEEEFID